MAQTHRILLLIGDNFGDFLDGYRTSPAGRLALMEKHRDKWGKQWIVLPNPMYGSWDRALYGHERGLSTSERQARKLGALDPWKPSGDSPAN